MKYTIKDLAEGRVAVKNDGTVEELREVLKLAFPDSGCHELYSFRNKHYYKFTTGFAGGTVDDEKIPIQSVKDFLKDIEQPNSTQFLHDKFSNKGCAENAIEPEHYAKGTIQPIDFIEANNLDFFEGCVVKYVARYKHKNGLEDLKKAQVYLQRLIDRYE